MRCHPNTRLFYLPQNLYCRHPSNQSVHFVLLWNSFSTFPHYTHTHTPPFKIWLPASSRKISLFASVTRLDLWPATFSFLLPPLHSPTLPTLFFLSGWITDLPSRPDSPMLCWYWSQRPQGESFWGQIKTSTPLTERLLRSKARSMAWLRGPSPTHDHWKYQDIRT